MVINRLRVCTRAYMCNDIKICFSILLQAFENKPQIIRVARWAG